MQPANFRAKNRDYMIYMKTDAPCFLVYATDGIKVSPLRGCKAYCLGAFICPTAAMFSVPDTAGKPRLSYIPNPDISGSNPSIPTALTFPGGCLATCFAWLLIPGFISFVSVIISIRLYLFTLGASFIHALNYKLSPLVAPVLRRLGLNGTDGTIFSRSRIQVSRPYSFPQGRL